MKAGSATRQRGAEQAYGRHGTAGRGMKNTSGTETKTKRRAQSRNGGRSTSERSSTPLGIGDEHLLRLINAFAKSENTPF